MRLKLHTSENIFLKTMQKAGFKKFAGKLANLVIRLKLLVLEIN